jgi:hypothetical protein
MRNPDDSRSADAQTPDSGPDGMYAPAVARRSRRRKQAVAGAVGLIALLGAGAVAAQQMADDGDTMTATEVGAVATPAPAGASGSVSAAPSSGTLPGALSAGPSAAKASPAAAVTTATASPRPSTVKERVAAARTAAEKAGTTVRKPLPNTNGGAVAAADEVKVTETGTLKENRAIMRVVSARQDLTGQRELAWAADEGVQVGNARCTQNFRLSAGAPVSEKPTLLLCWRTSATKTVYTVAVKLDSRPSKQESVDIIERTWAKMG